MLKIIPVSCIGVMQIESLMEHFLSNVRPRLWYYFVQSTFTKTSHSQKECGFRHKNLPEENTLYIYHPLTWEGNVLTPVCVSVHTCRGGTTSQVWLGGYPIPGLLGGTPSRSGWGGTPSQVWLGGVPHPRSGWGTPQTWDGVSPCTWDMVHPPQTTDVVPFQRWDLRWGTPWTWDGVPPPSIASTCYEAGGMPLAFTQDFLVYMCVLSANRVICLCFGSILFYCIILNFVVNFQLKDIPMIE